MNANPVAQAKFVETTVAEDSAETAKRGSFAWLEPVKMPHVRPTVPEKSAGTMGAEKAAANATPIWKSVRADHVSKCPLIVFPIAQG